MRNLLIQQPLWHVLSFGPESKSSDRCTQVLANQLDMPNASIGVGRVFRSLQKRARAALANFGLLACLEWFVTSIWPKSQEPDKLGLK
jgi:hypothetical protein